MTFWVSYAIVIQPFGVRSDEVRSDAADDNHAQACERHIICHIFRRQQRYTQNDVIYANSFEILECGASSSSL